MKKNFLILIISITSAFMANAQSPNFNPIPFNSQTISGTINKILSSDNGTVYVSDINTHCTVNASQENVIVSNGPSPVHILSSAFNDRMYLEKIPNVSQSKLMVNSTMIKQMLQVTQFGVVAHHRDVSTGRTLIAVGQSAYVQTQSLDPRIWVYVCDQNYNEVMYNIPNTLPSQTQSGGNPNFTNMVIPDGQNVVAMDNNNLHHTHLNASGVVDGHTKYDLGLTNIVHIDVNKLDNTLLILSDEGFSTTHLILDSLGNHQYEIIDQHQVPFPILSYLKYDIEDRDCDNDFDVIVFHPGTKEFREYEGTYTQNGLYNYDDYFLMTTQGDNAVIAWTEYSGVGYGWSPTISPATNNILVFNDLNGVCRGFVGVNQNSLDSYDGLVKIFNTMGQEVYSGRQLSEKQMKEQGWDTGMYFVKALDESNPGVKIKTTFISN